MYVWMSDQEPPCLKKEWDEWRAWGHWLVGTMGQKGTSGNAFASE